MITTSIGELLFLFDLQKKFNRLISFHSHLQTHQIETILAQDKKEIEVESFHHLHNIPTHHKHIYEITAIHSLTVPDQVQLTTYFDFLKYSQIYFFPSTNNDLYITSLQNKLIQTDPTQLSFQEIYNAYILQQQGVKLSIESQK